MSARSSVCPVATALDPDQIWHPEPTPSGARTHEVVLEPRPQPGFEHRRLLPDLLLGRQPIAEAM
jgi:hypothetical protein